MELRIFSNETNTEFRIGFEGQNFDMCSDENLSGVNNKVEIQITELQQKFGATTQYYDFRNDKICTKSEYLKHFESYNSDESYILPITTFTAKEQSEGCLEALNN